MSDDLPKLPAVSRFEALRAMRASNDEQLLTSWLDNLKSPHTRRNFETTARRLLVELPMGLRGAVVEDVREALEVITAGLSESTANQYRLRVKSLLSYAREVGFTQFNAGATIKVMSPASDHGARIAKRIIGETEVALMIRAATSRRDRVLLEVLYAGGLRVSELVGLTWSDVLPRDQDRVQLSVMGKGRKVRQVLLPAVVSRSLLSLRGDAGASEPLFVSRKGGALTERGVHDIVRRAAAAASIKEPVSPHWLRHAHGSHAIDRGAKLPLIQATLGHANIVTTSGYLHAKPGEASGLFLDERMFLRD